MKEVGQINCIICMDSQELTDEQIVEIARTTDKEAYGEIIRRYQAKLSHYLRKFINNSAELEDVLQEVFIKAYKNLYGFNTKQKFSSWIYRIAHNEALNNLKKRSKERLFLDEKELQIIDEKINSADQVDLQLLGGKMATVLIKLKDKYREPLILFYFEEKSYEEIGDILNLPINSVGTLIARGKKMLKKYL